MNYLEDNIPKKDSFLFSSLNERNKKLFLDFYSQLKKIKLETISLVVEPPISKEEKYDVICPVYWINDYFLKNITNWFEIIPIRKLYLGVNNPYLELISNHPQIEIIDQVQFKTLGKCLSDLMKRIQTKWFFFFHADVSLTSGLLEIMEFFKTKKTGIIESDRYHWDGVNYSNEGYNHKERAFSGVQLFKKKVFEDLLNRIEDDYIYRNEDLIFQFECIKQGYRYQKTNAMHIHQFSVNPTWTFNKNEAYQMQWKGLVKYTDPINFLIEAFLKPIKYLKENNQIYLTECWSFCLSHNLEWKEILEKEWVNNFKSLEIS